MVTTMSNRRIKLQFPEKMKESLVPLGSEEAPEREKLDPDIAVEEEVTAKAISSKEKKKK